MSHEAWDVSSNTPRPLKSWAGTGSPEQLSVSSQGKRKSAQWLKDVRGPAWLGQVHPFCHGSAWLSISLDLGPSKGHTSGRARKVFFWED